MERKFVLCDSFHTRAFLTHNLVLGIIAGTARQMGLEVVD